MNGFRRLALIGLLTAGITLLLLGTANSSSDSSEYEAYVVQQNQTLADIAAEYDLPVESIAQFNRIKASDPLTAGQVVLVPIMAQVTPQSPAAPLPAGRPAAAATSGGEKIEGVLGTVIAARAEIWSQPGSQGELLYDKVLQGTDVLVIWQNDTHYAVLMSDGSTGYMVKSALRLSATRMSIDKPTASSAPAKAGRMDMVETASRYMGVRYKYGGRLPDTVDCSLLIQTVFAKHGIKLPRTAAEQFKVGVDVPVSELIPGDRLYFYDRSMQTIGHTGMYIGNGRFIHASSNRGEVAIDDLTNKTYWNKFAGARR